MGMSSTHEEKQIRTQKTVNANIPLAKRYRLSVEAGDLLWLDGHWYVTHSGLIRLPDEITAPAYMWNQSSSSQIQRLHTGHLKLLSTSRRPVEALLATGMPIPPTSRFLSMAPKCVWRKLGPSTVLYAKPTESVSAQSKRSGLQNRRNPPENRRKLRRSLQMGTKRLVRPKVRDRLCQIIKQHQLDPDLVKAYATDFCGVKILREATREQVKISSRT